MGKAEELKFGGGGEKGDGACFQKRDHTLLRTQKKGLYRSSNS